MGVISRTVQVIFSLGVVLVLDLWYYARRFTAQTHYRLQKKRYLQKENDTFETNLDSYKLSYIPIQAIALSLFLPPLIIQILNWTGLSVGNSFFTSSWTISTLLIFFFWVRSILSESLRKKEKKENEDTVVPLVAPSKDKVKELNGLQRTTSVDLSQQQQQQELFNSNRRNSDSSVTSLNSRPNILTNGSEMDQSVLKSTKPTLRFSLMAKAKPIIEQMKKDFFEELEILFKFDLSKMKVKDLPTNLPWKFDHSTGENTFFNKFIEENMIWGFCHVSTYSGHSALELYQVLKNFENLNAWDGFLKSMKVLDKIDSNTWVIHLVYQTPSCSLDQAREICALITCIERNDGSFAIIARSFEYPEFSSILNEADLLTSGWFIKPTSSNSATITYVAQVDLLTPVKPQFFGKILDQQVQNSKMFRDFMSQ